MASYYYLISSLPMLKSDGSAPIDYKSFMEACKSSVSESTYETLEHLSDPKVRHTMINDWAEFYNALQEELNYQRRVALGENAVAPGDRDPELVNTVSAVLKAKNPLEAERMLLRMEFDKVDALTGLHSFDDHYLFGYAIKLKLLERQNAFKHDEGQEEFKKLFTGIRSQIMSM